MVSRAAQSCKLVVFLLLPAVALLLSSYLTACTVNSGLDQTRSESLSLSAGEQAGEATPGSQPDFAITSNGETTIPYENPLWAQLWTEQGWVARESLSVFHDIEAVLDELPTVTLREDIELSHAGNVSLGGLYACNAESLEMVLEGADRLYLTGLPEGTYYVGIQARKTGDYIEAEKRYEVYGSEYVFRLVVDELSYDKMLRSRPATQGISVMLRPTEFTGQWYSPGDVGYYVPADQDVWLETFERAAANASEQGLGKRESPIGVWIKHNDDYWCITDSGSLVIPGSSARRIKAEDAAELLALVLPVEKRYGVNAGTFRPELIEGIVSATLTLAGEEHTVTDPEVLAELEDLLTSATKLQVVTKCPFEATLTLNLERGDPVNIAVATDSCRVYMAYGVCFEYGSKDNSEFFGLFGVTLE